LGSTISQILQGAATSTAWVSYNDQPPVGSPDHESYGHTKGAIGFDSGGGFWLVQSTPRFPAVHGTAYTFPPDEKDNGQSFLCMSLGLNVINSVGHQLLVNKPWVYDSNLPSSLSTVAPNIQSVVSGGHWITKTSTNQTLQMKTTAGNTFTSYAKNAKWANNLYEAFVEPSLQTGMYLETWINTEDSNKMPNFCTPQYPYASMNAAHVMIDGVGWEQTKDHSKWGISVNVPGWVCIGDINRMYSQKERGGGTVCTNSSPLYKSFHSLINFNATC